MTIAAQNTCGYVEHPLIPPHTHDESFFTILLASQCSPPRSSLTPTGCDTCKRFDKSGGGYTIKTRLEKRPKQAPAVPTTPERPQHLSPPQTSSRTTIVSQNRPRGDDRLPRIAVLLAHEWRMKMPMWLSSSSYDSHYHESIPRSHRQNRQSLSLDLHLLRPHAFVSV